MKVGILTFSNAVNRGALMQCYALYSKILELGHTPFIISIELPGRVKSFKGKILLSIYKILFRRFRRKYYINKTRVYKSAEELRTNPPSADAYIVGSDQVWNREIISEFGSEAFFLNFVNGKERRIAYAASLGEDKWATPERNIKELIGKFNNISVREKEGIEIVERQFGVEKVENVLDPVFLFDNYDQLIGEKSPKNKNSILGMALLDTKLFSAILSEIEKDLKKDVYVIGSNPRGDSFKNHPFVGVKQWLKMIKSSHIVITNSFHCMAFSIILKRDFIVVPSFPGRENRMINLLEKLGLAERFVWDIDDYHKRKDQLFRHINYKEVSQKLDILRNESINFLKRALS